MAESMTSVNRLRAAERQRQALELRKEGRGFADIAAKLGYKSPSGAYQAVMSALRKTLQEPADGVRKLELERCDALWAAAWPKASTGDPQAIDKALKVMERRAKLLGLDAPTKAEHSGPGGGPIDVKVEDAREQLAARLAALATRRGESDTDSQPEPAGGGEATL